LTNHKCKDDEAPIETAAKHLNAMLAK